MKLTVKKDIEPQRAAALVAIDAWAKAERTKINTRDKWDIYRWKVEEANNWINLKGKKRELVNFPYLAAEVGITSPDADTLASLWITKWAEAQMAGPLIEKKTQLAKKAVRACTSPASIQAVLDGLT